MQNGRVLRFCMQYGETRVVAVKMVQAKKREMLDRETVLRCSQDYWFWKRIQDVVLSVLALAVLWLPMLVIALVIWLDSPGTSPLFAQIRIGRDGKPFRCYKFRTMCPNAEAEQEALAQYNEMDGPVFKIRNDPRITRVGRFLRRASIDELPQLLNILKGDMSIVGPRPALPGEVEQYDEYARQRLLVTPGLSCYWQIQPNRNGLSFEKWLELDLKYIKERSFLTDWKIIFATFGAVLGMHGQ